MTVTASFQVLLVYADCEVGVLRVHQEGGDWEERSKFDWTCTMLVKAGRAELWGALKMPTVSGARAIVLLCTRLGIQEANFERDGVMQTRRAKDVTGTPP